jgi:FtsH-binding integral membrane protein
MTEESNITTEEKIDNAEDNKAMRPIWFFVGLILFFTGLVLVITGIYNAYYPGQSGTVLEYLHPDIWWGGFMFLSGVVFIWLTRNSTVE